MSSAVNRRSLRRTRSNDISDVKYNPGELARVLPGESAEKNGVGDTAFPTGENLVDSRRIR